MIQLPAIKREKDTFGIMKNRSIFLITVLLRICSLFLAWTWVSFPPPSFADQNTPSDAPGVIVLSPDQQLEFADHYYREGEFYRAIGEYNRFLFFFPEDPRIQQAMYHIGMSYLHGQQYQDGIKIFNRLIHQFPHSSLALKAHLMVSDCYARLNQSASALTTLHNLLMQSHDEQIRDETNYRIGWIHLEMASWDKARSYFDNISMSNRKNYQMDQLLNELEESKHLKTKNPHLAGLLSLLPGFGYAYLERYSDALTALLVNGGLMYAAYSAFDSDNPALGGVITFVGFGFYSGNIFGSVSGAYKYNRNQTGYFMDRLRKHIKINLLTGHHNSSIMVALNYVF